MVTDDASQDSTVETIRSINDPRIRVFVHESNQGGGAARLTSFRQARGRYIAFLDHDDLWLPNKLQAQVSLAQSFKKDPLLLLYSKIGIDHGDFVTLSPSRPKGENESFVEYIVVRGQSIVSSCLFLTKELAQKTLSPTRTPLDDVGLLVRAEEAGAKFIFQPMITTIWVCTNKASYSRTADRKLLYEWLETTGKNLPKPVKAAVVTAWIWPSLSEQYPFLTRIRFLAKDFFVYGSLVAPSLRPSSIFRLLVREDNRFRVSARNAKQRLCGPRK